MKIAKGDKQIDTLEEWFLHAPPAQGEKHWVEGRSAKEFAREYLTRGAHTRLGVLLEPTFGELALKAAEPECSVYFDHFGGPRQCDLVVHAMTPTGAITIHIEGKADETFGEPVGKVYDKAAAFNAQARNVRLSHIPERIHLLTERMFGPGSWTEVRKLRYQLLFGTAAAVCDAVNRKARAAVFIVHEFHSHKTTIRKLAENSRDWAALLGMFASLTDAHLRAEDILLGPVSAAYDSWKDMPLYFAKLSTRTAGVSS